MSNPERHRMKNKLKEQLLTFCASLNDKVHEITADVILGICEENPIVTMRKHIQETFLNHFIEYIAEVNSSDNTEKLYDAYCQASYTGKPDYTVQGLVELLDIRPPKPENKDLFIPQSVCKIDPTIKSTKRKKVRIAK